MKVALVHYWLCNRRGGERVLESLCEMFPQADIFTLVYDPERLQSQVIAKHKVTTSFIQSLPFSRKRYQYYLPLMPIALEQFDLRQYDVIISSESGPAKGVLVPPSASHICYCHSPMRYVWDLYHDYLGKAPLVKKLLTAPVMHYLRIWDALSANRVDTFVANSNTIKNRIRACYRRDSVVVHPPVDVDDFSAEADREEFYLLAGELVPYKRPDIAVKACNQLGKRLVVIGGGPMEKALREMAGPTVTIMGRQPFDVLKTHYATCKALLFPGMEDFGIVPVEAMASGAPVLAFGKGGVCDSTIEGKTSLYFEEQSVDSLTSCICRFEEQGVSFSALELAQHAAGFAKSRFMKEMAAVFASHNICCK